MLCDCNGHNVSDPVYMRLEVEYKLTARKSVSADWLQMTISGLYHRLLQFKVDLRPNNIAPSRRPIWWLLALATPATGD